MDYQETIEIIQYASAFNSENSRLTKALNTAISAMQELQEYKKIGTLEEIREAVERQNAKKVEDIMGDKLKFCTCPLCGKRISNVEGGNYCQNCGQKLDWSEEE